MLDLVFISGGLGGLAWRWRELLLRRRDVM